MEIDNFAKLQTERNEMRQALVGLVGADTKDELEKMDDYLSQILSADAAKPMLDAIRVLRKTL